MDDTNPFDLTPYFYPRSTEAKKDYHIHHVPGYAHIANAAFDRIPSAYKNRTALDYYIALIKEYFIQ